MIGTTVEDVDNEQIRDNQPPSGTAIIRPLRHVHAVREQHLLRFAHPAEAAQSRAARAWAWALGETSLAPVTDRHTTVPPRRADIEAEVAEADQRIFRNDQEHSAASAAEILRWLIGDDDGIPIEVPNPGKLVGGFGDVVRSPEQLTHVLALTTERQREAVTRTRDLDASPAQRHGAQQEADFCAGVIATLAWILGEGVAPITSDASPGLTTRHLKTERLHAQDVIEQARYPWLADRLPPPSYGEGVQTTINWLLGDSTAAPVAEADLRDR